MALDRYDTISVKLADGLAHVEFVRSDRDNEVDSLWIREVADVFTELGRVPSLRAVVVSARGANFCAGMSTSARDELGLAWFADWEQTMRTVESLPVPVVCAVQGRCVGAGLQLATVCDIRVCAQDAEFVATVPGATLVPGMSWWRLPRFLGAGRAKYLIMASSSIDAAEAHRIGLVDEIVDDSPVTRAVQIARELFAFSPTAFAETKRLMNDAATMSHEQAVAEFLVAELRCLAALQHPPAARLAHPDPQVASIAEGQRAALDALDTPDFDTPPALGFDPRW